MTQYSVIEYFDYSLFKPLCIETTEKLYTRTHTHTHTHTHTRTHTRTHTHAHTQTSLPVNMKM